LRKEKLKAEEAKLLAKEQARTKAYLAREQELEKGQKARELREAGKRASEDIKGFAREKARKETYLAQEKLTPRVRRRESSKIRTKEPCKSSTSRKELVSSVFIL
jgi:hypothetical protein